MWRINLSEYKVIFIVVTAVVALLVASPVLSRILVYPRTEFFSEMWLLGPNHKAEGYPYNISQGQNYTVFLGIGNQLGYCAYYVVEVKFRNQSQSVPSSFGPIEERVPSNLSSLFGVRVFVADEGVWEAPLTFSFDYGFNESLMRVEFSSLNINGVAVDLAGQVIMWDAGNEEFRGFLFFEVWLYDAEVDDFGYHGRFVSLRLNMTV
jgi:hypothetical protein